ncbi:MAG: hypothetical protein COX62_02350 [Deltaproteobacteria bacterium CG_4_10_14_0_2_um_filter_43_8]|nr:MAG: hypothetical protein COV43_07700 [Deltaproteobacteria bacterium CG11_big_fil_rev_8_21_14_0_20_42_23]PJA21482.1 MAG: hypothetical protein COX62_02350 [Deltaproteobacteria bacterium CG_4_10_14_0_2_um_filter_43_8]PJC63347.1 MAG: hypothetical protein CO021_10065 [Deltaproteobacteria bacterium CG_4_9_14_0_2_um_filter_42_21]
MKKFILFFFIFLSSFCFSASAENLPAHNRFDYSFIAQVPVLHEGRVKPLDTFARANLLYFSGKSSLQKKSATEWLAHLFFRENEGDDERIFSVLNPDVLVILGLGANPKHLYTFNEVSAALKNILKTVEELHQKKKEDRTPAQNQIVDLYFKTIHYYDLKRSFSLFFTPFLIHTKEVASFLKLEQEKPYSYFDLLPLRHLLESEVKKIAKKDLARLSEREIEITSLAYGLSIFDQDVRSKLLRIIPPQWANGDQNWLSPWQVLSKNQGSPESAAYLSLWKNARNAYANNQEADWKRLAQTIAEKGKTFVTRPWALRLEYYFSLLDPFTKSMALYILSFLLLSFSWVFWKIPLQRVSLFVLSFSLLLHAAGIISRILILMRPPVSTLYESIIFVAFVAALFGFLFERVKKNGLGLFIASLLGASLLFLSRGYASDGDTMGMLVAVLNTNFWLATHVVTITIGYACCFVAGITGHVYLVRRLFSASAAQLKEMYHAMLGMSLFALFFTLFGTILGGIWADQSWGRFWGWDPKENGALLIVLWLLFLLHGILTKYLKHLGFAVGMVFTNIIVALAWFGVNLLNVGLHSYGFTENIFFNLMLFCSLELVFALVLYTLISYRELKS